MGSPACAAAGSCRPRRSPQSSGAPATSSTAPARSSRSVSSVLAFEHLDQAARAQPRACSTPTCRSSATSSSRDPNSMSAPTGRDRHLSAAPRCRRYLPIRGAPVNRARHRRRPRHFFQAPGHFRVGFSGATDQLRGGLERVRRGAGLVGAGSHRYRHRRDIDLMVGPMPWGSTETHGGASDCAGRSSGSLSGHRLRALIDRLPLDTSLTRPRAAEAVGMPMASCLCVTLRLRFFSVKDRGVVPISVFSVLRV